MAAGLALGCCLIAGDGEAVVNAQFSARADDVRFAHVDKRCMHTKACAFNASLGGQISHLLKGGDVFRTAIRITGVIHCIHAEKNVTAMQGFGQSQCQRQHHGIACWHVGAGYAGLAMRLRNIDGEVGERRTTKLVHIDMNHAMAQGAECFGLT